MNATAPSAGENECAAVCGGAPSLAFALRAAASLPRALDVVDKLLTQLVKQRRRVVFFLDYDGTLSPIVDDPERAWLPEPTRQTLCSISSRFTTAIVSGRSKDKVKALVNVRGLIYAGSHGFDIEGPRGVNSHRVGERFLPALRAARGQLQEMVPSFVGSSVEDNVLSVSFHYRRCEAGRIPELRARVEGVASQHGLRLTHGKKVYELRPLFDWNKGKAVEYLLEVLKLNGAHVMPIYIGDDTTDEDAFKVLRGKGLSVLVDGAQSARRTCADWRLSDPGEVHKFLLRFADEPQLEGAR